jgi:hypothetical protein
MSSYFKSKPLFEFFHQKIGFSNNNSKRPNFIVLNNLFILCLSLSQIKPYKRKEAPLITLSLFHCTLSKNNNKG